MRRTNPFPSARPRTTLVLGGGGARGLAHLGVIEVLLEAGFPIERLVGVSMGGIVAALHAFHGDIARIQREIVAFLGSPEFQPCQELLCGVHPSARATPAGHTARPLTEHVDYIERIRDWPPDGSAFLRLSQRPSLLPGDLLAQIVDRFLPDADLADAPVRLSIVAVDLRSGRQVVLERGPVRDAVRASASLPGIFPPVEWDGMLLCDVGVFYPLPTTVARQYDPEYVIGSDVTCPVRPIADCPTALDVLLRMDQIGESLFHQHARTSADLIIHPDVAAVKWFDFSASEELIARGRTAARQSLAGPPGTARLTGPLEASAASTTALRRSGFPA